MPKEKNGILHGADRFRGATARRIANPQQLGRQDGVFLDRRHHAVVSNLLIAEQTNELEAGRGDRREPLHCREHLVRRHS